MGRVQLVVRPMSRRVTLRLDHATRMAILVLPHKRYRRQAEKLLRQREDWLTQQWRLLPPAMPFVDGGEILLRGERVKLQCRLGRGKAKLEDGKWVVPATQETAFAGRVRRALIEQARLALQERVANHAQNLCADPARITVRDTRSRWGSCSAAGNLNFSWRLVCAPTFVLDYVAAHEVAHLKEPHHGPAFWAEVKKSFGPHQKARKYLGDHGPELFAVGADR